MKNAIIIHGTCDEEEYFSDAYPSLSNSHWLPWLQKQLLIKGIHAETPEMPNGYNPTYEAWETTFERFEINESTILVGHSSGGGFLLRWLSENKVEVGTVILVAPWLDPDTTRKLNFFDFSIDPNLISRTKKLKIFVSNNDEADILKSVQIIRDSLINIEVREFDGLGHFTEGEMGRVEFPELLAELL